MKKYYKVCIKCYRNNKKYICYKSDNFCKRCGTSLEDNIRNENLTYKIYIYEKFPVAYNKKKIKYILRNKRFWSHCYDASI